jgi:Zn-dependent M28 family amino/carboxypeptidase
MLKRRMWVGACVLALVACAGDTSEAASQVPTIDRDRMLADVEVLAADSMEGRLVGSEGNRMAREFVAARFGELGLAAFGESYIQEFTATRRNTEIRGANVVGYVAGREAPDRFIVITAHYDHLGVRDGKIFNGADDNASGTAALMAFAEYFSRHQPQHSMIFAAFDAEERGLTGSRAFVDDPPVDLSRMAVNINMDMVSHSDSELYVAGTYHYPFLRPYVERVMEAAGVTLVFGHDSPELGHDDWTGASDHAPFHQHGIPFLYFGVEDHPDYHQPSDVYANINPEFFVNAVHAILRVVLELDHALEPVIERRGVGGADGGR